jgi:uncharacterized phiE125 gp8 family phage protein
MSLTLVTPPAVLPLTLTQVKQHLRVDHDDEDATIAAILSAATSHLDGREGLLGRCLLEQTWELRLDAFPCRWTGQTVTRDRAIEVPLPPLREVVSVKYVDENGDLQTLAPSVYQIIAGGFGLARIAEAWGQSWPVTRDEPDAVRVTFKAGYAAATEESPPAAGEGVPTVLLHALKLIAGHLYEHREAVAFDQRDPPVLIPMGVFAFINPFRIGVLGA